MFKLIESLGRLVTTCTPMVHTIVLQMFTVRPFADSGC